MPLTYARHQLARAVLGFYNGGHWGYNFNGGTHRRRRGIKGGMLSVKPEGPTLEARTAESGGGVLVEGAANPLATS